MAKRETGAYYRSNHPEVIAAWEAFQKRAKKHGRALKAFEKKWAPLPGLKLYHETRSRRPMFFAYVSRRDLARVGVGSPWARWDGNPMKIRPRASGKGVDKELLAAWDKLHETAGDIKLPGMPQSYFYGLGEIRPGIEQRDDGYVYVEWGGKGSHEVLVKHKLDVELWERLPASQWFALVEALEVKAS
jgi:hypothetical protein